MNPYDDDAGYRSRSRAARHGRDDDYATGGHDPYEGYAEPTTRGMTGPGRASVGRAAVPGSPRPTSPAEPVYGAPYGDAAYGGSGYGSSGGGSGYGSSGGGSGYGSHSASSYGSGDPYGPAPTSPPGGTPVSPARGVGRAQVRPVSPSPPPTAGGGGAGRGPGLPPVPGAPGGDGPDETGEGPAWRRPFRGFGLGGERRRGRDGAGTGPKGPRGKWSRRTKIRNIIIISVAVLVMLAGGGFVAATLYVDGVELGDELVFPETSSIYYNDGTTLLARLGENTRYAVPFENMSTYVTEAMIASEDQTFWTNEGVEFSAVVRAAWNNVTGGETQGGSTITQQYARIAFKLKGATYNRKIREAVLAWKMSDELSKPEILSSYLNSVEFGRQTFGAEAAARAFFHKTIMINDPPAGFEPITRSEAMALVAMVKQPYANPANPEGAPGYDPTRGERARELAIGRWEYVRNALTDLNAQDPERFTLTAEEAATLVFPESWIPESALGGEGRDKPAGLVERHVLDEITNSEGSPLSGMPWGDIRSGGYEIVTTLHPGAQQAAERAADETVAGSVMNGQPANLQAALVAVEPGTGRVLAYYGGHDGTGSDFAGIYRDENNQFAGHGRHPPGSSFKIYTLGAALRNGISLNSYWEWTPHAMPGRPENNPIRNSADCSSDLLRDEQGRLVRGPNPAYPDLKSGSSSRYLAASGACSLLESTVRSLNVPFYGVAANVSAGAVLQMAMDAGIEHIWNDARERIELLDAGVSEAVRNRGIGTEVGIGQYPITPMEHANGAATFAAGGLRAKAHFVKEVFKDGKRLYGETLPNPNSARVLIPEQLNDLTYALTQVANIDVAGFQAATKTGTWEYAPQPSQNAHAWNVGYTTKLAAAVWVGNKGDEQPLKDKNNDTVFGSGLPRSIWRAFMGAATQAMDLPRNQLQFNPPNFTGDENPPGSTPSPTQSASPSPSPSESPSPEPSESPSPEPSPSESTPPDEEGGNPPNP
jgi:membrane peptidoglycan carboxypeptidase